MIIIYWKVLVAEDHQASIINLLEEVNCMAERSSKGRGWHGDSAGHAKAGSQSHKNDGKRSLSENQENSDQQL